MQNFASYSYAVLANEISELYYWLFIDQKTKVWTKLERFSLIADRINLLHSFVHI